MSKRLIGALQDPYFQLCWSKHNHISLSPDPYSVYSDTILDENRSMILFEIYKLLMTQQHEENLKISRETMQKDENGKLYSSAETECTAK